MLATAATSAVAGIQFGSPPLLSAAEAPAATSTDAFIGEPTNVAALTDGIGLVRARLARPTTHVRRTVRAQAAAATLLRAAAVAAPRRVAPHQGSAARSPVPGQ